MAYSKITATGNGVTKDYSVTFDYLDQSHVRVRVNKVFTNAVGSNYTFEFINATTVRITHVVSGLAPASGDLIEIIRETPIANPAVVFGPGVNLTSDNLNKNSEYLTYALQEASDTNQEFTKLYLGSKATFPTTDNDGEPLQTGTVIYYIPESALYYYTGTTWIIGESTVAAQTFAAAAEAAKNAAVGAQNAAAASATAAATSASNASSSATSASSSASSASTSATNAAASATAAGNSQTAAAGSATASATSASSASTSATNAANSASAASTSATNAANSATAASGSATSAASSASSATTSASNAASSATAAAGSATSAATSATNAANSASAAATSASDAATILTTRVVKTSDTGSAAIPTGTQAQRDGSPLTGYFRFNTTLGKFEGYNGSSWGSVGGGATGGGADAVFIENDQVVTTNYAITSGRNAMTTGPITINSGVTVTVPAGSNWVVL